MDDRLRDALMSIFCQVKYITAWQFIQSVLLMAIAVGIWAK